MKMIVVTLTLVSFTQAAFALDGSDKAELWTQAGTTERSTWVSAAVDAVNVKSSRRFTKGEVKSCLDSLLKTPIPASIAAITMSNATAACMATIKNN